VLYFELEGGNSFIARPSGTEPKIKFYLMCKGKDESGARDILERIRGYIKTIV
jgi:phosphoglucomutase